MTAPITITLDDQQVRAALERLAARVADPTPAMREIGELPGNDIAGGYVLVVKATRTGKALWVTSYRRLHEKEAVRDSEIRRLLKKEKK